MKRLITFMLMVVFVFLSAVSVYAADENGVSFRTEGVVCNKDRLFTVDIKANSSERLSAVLFSFSYDRELMEYRSVSTSSDSVVYAYDNGSTVNVSYLCSEGKDIGSETVIFSLKFKSLAVGQTDLSYTTYDCVNSSAQSVPISQCSSGKVMISSENNGFSDKGTESEEPEASVENGSNYRKSTSDELGLINGSFSDNTTFMLIVGILCGLAVGMLCFILYLFLIKKKNNPKKEKERSRLDI